MTTLAKRSFGSHAVMRRDFLNHIGRRVMRVSFALMRYGTLGDRNEPGAPAYEKSFYDVINPSPRVEEAREQQPQSRSKVAGAGTRTITAATARTASEIYFRDARFV